MTVLSISSFPLLCLFFLLPLIVSHSFSFFPLSDFSFPLFINFRVIFPIFNSGVIKFYYFSYSSSSCSFYSTNFFFSCFLFNGCYFIFVVSYLLFPSGFFILFFHPFSFLLIFHVRFFLLFLLHSFLSIRFYSLFLIFYSFSLFCFLILLFLLVL